MNAHVVRKWLFLVFLLGVVAPAAAAPHEAHGTMGEPHEMASVAETLKSLSGPAFDKAFFSMMIPHHEAAVAMSLKILETTKDAHIMKWASAISDGQEREIATMRQALEPLGGIDRALYDKMAADMRSMALGATDDREFARLMIPHHESAIEMASLAEGRTKNPALLKLASDILSTQKDEIEEFRAWLKSE